MINQVLNQSQIIYNKARMLFEDVQRAMQEGEIESKRELMSELLLLYDEYFTLMNKPQLSRNEVYEGTPIFSEDYNEMLYDIYQDFTILYREMEIISDLLTVDYNIHTTEVDMLNELARETMDRLKDLEIYNTVQDNQNKFFARDHFLNSDRIDYDLIKGPALLIDNGNLTLPIESEENIAPKGEIKIAIGGRSQENIAIGSESNGYPGNNTEVVSVRDNSLLSRGYDIKFIGEEDSHGKYGVILNPENKNQWFEYERVEVKDRNLLERVENFGAEYHVEGSSFVRWVDAPENGKLKLNLQISLPKEELINNIDISLYIPSNYDAKPAHIYNIVIHNQSGESTSVVEYKAENQTSFFFKPTYAKTINIYFEQKDPYYTQVGHIYYQEKIEANNYAEYALEETKKMNNAHKRVIGPSMRMADLGAEIEVTPHMVELDYPYRGKSGGGGLLPISGRLKRMSQLVDDNIDLGIESIEARRWCIGVKNIKVNKIKYADYGELITKPFYFDTPLEKISLNIQDGLSEVQNWFEYYVSIDDGATWHPITPIEHQDSGYPKIYTVRTNKEVSAENEYGYIESPFDVYSIRFKIIGKKEHMIAYSGENNLQEETPILHNFKLNASLFNELEFHDDSYIDFDKPTTENEMPDIEEWIKPTDSLSLKDLCIEEWVGDPETYYITGDVKMSNPIDRIEFYENGVLKKTMQVFSPADVYFKYTYRFALDKMLYPMYNLALHKQPYVIAYDTQGRKLTGYHHLQLKICEEELPGAPGLGAYIQGKDTTCEEYPYTVNAIGYSTGVPVEKLELYLNGELIHTEYPKTPGEVIWMNYTLEEGLKNNRQHFFKVVAWDSNGKAAVDRFYPTLEFCPEPPEEQLIKNLGLNKSLLCECENLSIGGHIQTRTPVKRISYKINDKPFFLSNFDRPSKENPCKIIEERVLRIDRKHEILEELSQTSFEDCSPCEKRRISRLERELALIEEVEESSERRTSEERVLIERGEFAAKDYYEIYESMTIPGWILKEMKLVNEKNHSIEIEIEEVNGRVHVEVFKFKIIECITKDCNDLLNITFDYYDFFEKEIKNITLNAGSLPYLLDNGIGEHYKVGWDMERNGLYFRTVHSVGTPGLLVANLSYSYVAPNRDIIGDRFDYAKYKQGGVYGEQNIPLTHKTKSLKEEIKQGRHDSFLNIKGGGSVVVLERNKE